MANCYHCGKKIGMLESKHIDFDDHSYHLDCVAKHKLETWISVSIECKLSKKYSKKEILEISQNMCEIVMNTHMLVGKAGLFSKNEILGFVNPILNINAIMTNGITRGNTISYKISKKIFFHIIEDKEYWKVMIFPVKDYKKFEPSFYALPLLYYELPIWGKSAEYLLDNFEVMKPYKESSFDIDIVNTHPIIIRKEHLLRINYSIIDRIHSRKEYPKLDEYILSGSLEEYVDNVRNRKIIKKPNSEDEKIRLEWLRLVDEALDKEA